MWYSAANIQSCMQLFKIKELLHLYLCSEVKNLRSNICLCHLLAIGSYISQLPFLNLLSSPIKWDTLTDKYQDRRVLHRIMGEKMTAECITPRKSKSH